MKKTIKQHAERLNKHKAAEKPEEKDAVPAYLLDREGMSHAKVLSNSIKQKRKEKAGKWSVPIPKVRPVGEDEVFKVMASGKRKKKQWKRMVNKVTFVGESFTRKPPKYERFVRPAALRFKQAHVTHPELKATFNLDLIGIKKNPQSPLYTSLGVITKGTVIEVNCADLGLVTPLGKVVWGQIRAGDQQPGERRLHQRRAAGIGQADGLSSSAAAPRRSQVTGPLEAPGWERRQELRGVLACQW